VRLSLERLFSDPPLAGRGLTGVEWHPDGRRFSYLEPRDPEGTVSDLWTYDVQSGERACVISGEALRRPGDGGTVALSGYQWLPDGARLLLHDRGEIWLYSLAGGALTLVTAGVDRKAGPRASPDGGRIAFVRERDLWVHELGIERETRLTEDGGAGVFNGRLDWVYWEELANRKDWRAFEWSPDGTALAFLRWTTPGCPSIRCWTGGPARRS
jgi:dipeptidyl-peptidase-4